MKKILILIILIIPNSLLYCLKDANLASIAEEISKVGTKEDVDLAVQIYKLIQDETFADDAAEQINQKWPNTITPQIAKERYPLLKTSEEIGAATKRVLTKHKDLINIAPGVNCTGI